MIPSVNSDLLTKADREALYRMPEGWFDSDDLFPGVRRGAYRCDRLHKLGYLDYDVIGTYPHLESRYRKKPETEAIIQARYR